MLPLLHIRRTVILTRPETESRLLAERILDHDPSIEVHVAPLLKISPVEHTISDAGRSSGIVFTSANAVKSLDLESVPDGLLSWCVGARTAEAARDRGFRVKTAGGSAQALLEMIRNNPPDNGLIYARGSFVSLNLADQLRGDGIPVTEIVTYKQVALALEGASRRLIMAGPCLVSLFSVRTAEIFTREATGLPDNRHLAICASQNVSAGFGLDWQRLIMSSLDHGDIVPAIIKHSGGGRSLR